MATSTFFTSFKTGPGAKLEGYSGHIYLVPSGSAVNGDMPLTEDTGRPGQYFRENVPDGEYKVYVDLDKSGSPVEGDLYKIPGSGNPYLVWHGEKTISDVMAGTATPTTKGLMSAADKEFLNNLAYLHNADGQILFDGISSEVHNETRTETDYTDNAQIMPHVYNGGVIVGSNIKIPAGQTGQSSYITARFLMYDKTYLRGKKIKIRGYFLTSRELTDFDDTNFRAGINSQTYDGELIDQGVISATFEIVASGMIKIEFELTVHSKAVALDPYLQILRSTPVPGDITFYLDKISYSYIYGIRVDENRVVNQNELISESTRKRDKNYKDSIAKYDVITDEAQSKGIAVYNGATAGGTDGKKVIIPVGQTGQSSYNWVYFPANKLNRGTRLLNKKVVCELLLSVKNLQQLTSIVCNASLYYSDHANSYLCGTPLESGFIEPDYLNNTAKFYARVEVTPAYSDLTKIQILAQAQNSNPVTSEVSFEILEAYVYIKPSSDKTLFNENPLTVNHLLKDFEEKIYDALYSAYAPKTGYIYKTVKQDGTGNFTTIQAAIDSCTDASELKQYKILVYPGTYQATALTDYVSDGSYYNFIKMSNFVHLRGMDRDTTIIYSELSDSDATNITVPNHQTIKLSAIANIENLTIKCKNNRYPVHIDAGKTGLKDGYVRVDDCYIEHLGNKAATWSSQHAWGCGTSDGLVMEFNRTTFVSGTSAFYFHTNADFERPNYITLNNCSLINRNGTDALQIVALGTGQNDILTLNNCTINGKIGYYDDPWLSTSLSGQKYNHAEVKIRGGGNTPAFYHSGNTDGSSPMDGKALRIVSATAGAGSSIRLSGNAANVIAANYEYKDGADVFAGYALGHLDVGEEAIGINQDTYIKSLGKRLGDCSSANKTLTVTINGTITKNIVFNTNLTNVNNATILSSINAVLGADATASLYVKANEYYPEFNDAVMLCRNSLATGIPKGYGVKRDSAGALALMTAADAKEDFLGITLDDIYPGEMGRVLTKGYLSTYYPTNYFYPVQKVYVSARVGFKYGMSDVPGKFAYNASITLLKCYEDDIIRFNC